MGVSGPKPGEWASVQEGSPVQGVGAEDRGEEGILVQVGPPWGHEIRHTQATTFIYILRIMTARFLTPGEGSANRREE